MYSSFVQTPSDSPINVNYILEVKEGENLLSVGQQLAKDKAISQPYSLPIIAQTKTKFNLLPTKYILKLPATPAQIIDQLKTQSDQIAKAPQSDKQTSIKLTFKEGDTIDDIIDRIAESNIASRESLQSIARDPEAFSTKEYEFLPQPLDCKYGETQTCAKYYLEGYLYPDTYEFFVPAEPKQIFGKLLTNFRTKAWQKVENQVQNDSSLDFAKVITMASVIERETGRPIEGVNTNNIDQLETEKKLMAGTFFNRLKIDMKWESDPTVIYGTGESLCQQTLVSQKNCLYLDSPEADNKYNTYKNVGYPIAPITTPTVGSIQAVLNPTSSEYLFFVSDASGIKYFAKSNEEHESNIQKVNEINQKYRK